MYFEVASNPGETDTDWIQSSGNAHRGKRDMLSSDVRLSEMTNNLSHGIHGGQTVYQEYLIIPESALKPDYVIFERRNNIFFLLQVKN